MRVERVDLGELEMLRIHDADRLDPVRVILHDVRPGCGALLIECYGAAWASNWSAIGNRKMREFIVACEIDYLVSRLWPAGQQRTKREHSYLTRIVTAVHQALSGSTEGGERPCSGSSATPGATSEW